MAAERPTGKSRRAQLVADHSLHLRGLIAAAAPSPRAVRRLTTLAVRQVVAQVTVLDSDLRPRFVGRSAVGRPLGTLRSYVIKRARKYVQ